MKYKSCRFLEYGIYFKALDDGTCEIKPCCNMDAFPIVDQSPIFKNYEGGPIDWDSFFKIKNELRNCARNGIYPKTCINCFELKESDWIDENYISHLTFAHITKCNSRCVYCYIGCNEKSYSAPQKFEIMPVLSQMHERGILRYDGSLRFMGGEPTLMTDFDEIVSLFNKNNVPELYIPTSGIKFSKVLENAIRKIPYSEVFISIDSGSSETYKKIKRINAYDIVLNSIKRYSDAAKSKDFIKSKYIIVPEYNDNTKEINKWIAESVQIGLSNIVMDFEYSYVYDENKERYLKHCYKIAEYTKQRIKGYNLVLNTYSPFFMKGIQILKKNLYGFENKCEDFNDLHFLERLFICYDKLISANNPTDINKEQTGDIISRFENSNKVKEISIDVSSSSFDCIKLILEDLFLKKCLYKNCLISIHSNAEVTNTSYLYNLLYYLYFSGFYISVNTDAYKYSENVGEALRISDTILTIIPKYSKTFFGSCSNNYKSIKNVVHKYVKDSEYSGKVNIKYIMKSKNNDTKDCISSAFDFAQSVSINEIIFVIDKSLDKDKCVFLKSFIETKSTSTNIKVVIQ